MATAREMTRCPYCKESIIAGATKCKHCQSELPAKPVRKNRLVARLNTFRTGFLAGVVFTLIIFFLFYHQFG